MATHDTTRPTRRALLAGAAATLPAVPAFALPAVIAHDDLLDNLIACAVDTGLNLDMLEAMTRGLDAVACRKVLANMAAFSEGWHVRARPRHLNPLIDVLGAIEEVGNAVAKIAADHPSVDTWSFGLRGSENRNLPSGDIMLAKSRRELKDGIDWTKDDYLARYEYRDGTLETDDRFPMARA